MTNFSRFSSSVVSTRLSRRTETLSTAVKSRGYRLGMERSAYRPARLGGTHLLWAGAVLAIAFGVLAVWWSAFGLGGFLGTVGVDITRYAMGTPVLAYVLVFAAQAGLFLYAARLMLGVHGAEAPVRRDEPPAGSLTPGLEEP